MVTEAGKVGIKITITEDRHTWYKLHPNQAKYPGQVITMPNLPNDDYHRNLYYKKGYKREIQELMPGKKFDFDEKYGGYRFLVDSPVPSQVFTCDICKQECASEFGLMAHKRKHDIK